jgi:hypothetical protein
MPWMLLPDDSLPVPVSPERTTCWGDFAANASCSLSHRAERVALAERAPVLHVEMPRRRHGQRPAHDHEHELSGEDDALPGLHEGARDLLAVDDHRVLADVVQLEAVGHRLDQQLVARARRRLQRPGERVLARALLQALGAPVAAR